MPASQAVQALVPEVRALYVPAAHPEHEVAPVETDAYKPAEQGKQVVEVLAAVVLLNLPIMHAVQTLASVAFGTSP